MVVVVVVVVAFVLGRNHLWNQECEAARRIAAGLRSDQVVDRLGRPRVTLGEGPTRTWVYRPWFPPLLSRWGEIRLQIRDDRVVRVDHWLREEVPFDPAAWRSGPARNRRFQIRSLAAHLHATHPNRATTLEWLGPPESEDRGSLTYRIPSSTRGPTSPELVVLFRRGEYLTHKVVH